MSVLIKGMDMPSSCADCLLQVVVSSRIEGAYCVCAVNDRRIDDGHEKWCPLVEVKTPHGGLIDADAMIEDLRNEILEIQMNGMKGTPVYDEDLRQMIKRLEDKDIAPTVVEAEE